MALVALPASCSPPASPPDAAPNDAAPNDAAPMDAAPNDAASSNDGGIDAAMDATTDAAADARADGGSAVAEGHLRGRVVEALTLDNVAIAGARVTAANGATTVTGADGSFALVGIPSGTRTAIRITPPSGALSYSSTQLLIDMPARGDVRAIARLLRGCSTVVNLAGGQRSRALSPCGTRGALVGVELPMGGVVNAAGVAVARVRMEIAAIPSLAGELVGEAFMAFPGDMTARDSAGMDAWIESRGAAEVRLFDDATGEPAQLAPGREATVTLPASPKSIEDRALRVWSYSERDRAWIEEGRGELAVDEASGMLVTRLTVPHFSWWNSDQVATRTCLTGRIEITGGVSLGTTTMMATGVDYLGSTIASIAADGTFRIFARANSIVDLAFQSDVGRGVFQSARLTTGARDACVDVGVITIDSTRVQGCARGVARDALGAPIANADISATQLGRTVQTRSAADGTFCLPLISGARAVVRAEATDGANATIRGSIDEVLAAPGASCGGACTDLGALTLRATSCIAGTLSDFAGPAARAWVSVSGRSSGSTVLTRADGSFCAPVAAGDRYSVLGVVNNGARVSTAEIPTIVVGPSAGSCAMPSSCANAPLTANDIACVRGVARDSGGAPIAGATVRARPAQSTRFTSAVTGADGSFCVPARSGERATIEIVRETRTTRDYVAFAADVSAGAATCGGAGCTDVGARELRRETFATCIRGRILDGAVPVRTPIEAHTVDRVAILRPREDGRFCLEADPGLPGTITLRDPNTVGCARDRETSITTTAIASPSCLDEARCLDVGTLDFADFCAGS
ncbi:MAG: carboxypeptidase-like regulatory domain-containing protein [Polyangiales bacterium]